MYVHERRSERLEKQNASQGHNGRYEMDHTEYAKAQIARALEAGNRGDAAGRNIIISRLKGDSELSRTRLTALLVAAGLQAAK